jgi:glycosyltransferase involved in cell wall biosynthesis
MSSNLETGPPDKDTVAVCIPTYNQAAFLGEAIRSVLAQTHRVDEIIVSDDASTDETPKICEQFIREVPHFRYFRQERNLGMGGNVEFVLRQAKTTYAARLDSDDRLLPDFLEVLIASIKNHPQAGYAHANVWEIDGNGNRARPRILYREPGFQPAKEALVASLRGYRVAANVVLFRSSALEKVEIMKGPGDFVGDYHLSVALARAGYGNVFVAQSLAEYRVWFDPKGIRARRMEQILRGLVRVFDEQIEPSFKEAGLSLDPVRGARKACAIRSAIGTDIPDDSPEEKERMRKLLLELGDCLRLRLLIWMIQMRLGFLVRAYWRLNDFLRQIAKQGLSLFR